MATKNVYRTFWDFGRSYGGTKQNHKTFKDNERFGKVVNLALSYLMVVDLSLWVQRAQGLSK